MDAHQDTPKWIEYEKRLGANLARLRDELRSSPQQLVGSTRFQGKLGLQPKGFTNPAAERDPKFSTSWELRWNSAIRAGNEMTMSYRVVAHLSIDFHVLGALWLMRIGVKIDRCLSGSAMGNRMRQGGGDAFRLRSFRRYQPAWQRWRESSSRAIEKELLKEGCIAVATGDVQSFYPSLKPDFMLHESFLSEETEFSSGDLELHRLFAFALQSWSEMAGSFFRLPHYGIPIGLPASSAVANAALMFLDRDLSEVADVYYGRYVDDLIIAYRIPADPKSDYASHLMQDPWRYLCERIKSLAQVDDQIVHTLPDGQQLVFAMEKTRSFILEGDDGLALLEELDAARRETSSEWRSIGQLNAHAPGDLPSVLVTDPQGGNSADFRHAERVGVSRARFAIRLSEAEKAQSLFGKGETRGFLVSFVESAMDTVIAPDRLAEFAPYLLRVTSLVLAVGAIDQSDAFLRTFLDHLLRVTRAIDDGTKSRLWPGEVTESKARRLWHIWVTKVILESWVRQSWDGGARAIGEFCRDVGVPKWHSGPYFRDDGQSQAFIRDLATVPYKSRLLQSSLAPAIEDPRVPQVRKALLPHDSVVRAAKILSGMAPESIRARDVGIMFPTRVMNRVEMARMFCVERDAESSRDITANMDEVAEFYLGFRPRQGVIHFSDATNGMRISANAGRSFSPSGQRKQILAMVPVSIDKGSIRQSIEGGVSGSLSEYNAIANVLGTVTAHNQRRPNLLLMPEWALPVEWFLHFAQKLAEYGVVLVSGVHPRVSVNVGEARMAERSASNQTLIALPFSSRDFSSFVLLSSRKEHAAEAELVLLQELDVDFRPGSSGSVVYSHRGLDFAILTCRDFLDIRKRMHYRGEIDLLLVPSWNRDIDTFANVAKAASLDLHCYVAVCNEASAGESRVRTPAKERFRRDVLRLRGGGSPILVSEELNVGCLRRAHSQLCERFKPLPPGFVPGEGRPDFLGDTECDECGVPGSDQNDLAEECGKPDLGC